MNILIVYWSETGNTEMMAKAIAEGVKKAGKGVELVHVDDNPDIASYDSIIFGCPSSGSEELEESAFEPFFQKAEENLKNKNVALFGSYGWGNGEWMDDWENRVKGAGATLFDKGLIVNYTPGQNELDECESLGERFAKL